MKRKNLLISLILTLSFCIVILLPIKSIAQLVNEPFQLPLTVLIKSIFLSVFFVVALKKLHLREFAGLGKGISRKYWMLIIPLLYPGVWGHKDFRIECNLFNTLLVLLPILVRAIWEELIFRGLIQGYLVSRTKNQKLHSIALYTSFFFAAGHLINLRVAHPLSVANQFVFAFMTGMIFSAIHFHVKNIWLLGVSHGLLNFIFKGCSSEPIIFETEEPGISEYISQLIGFIAISIPGFFMYWLLMKFLPRSGSH